VYDITRDLENNIGFAFFHMLRAMEIIFDTLSLLYIGTEQSCLPSWPTESLHYFTASIFFTGARISVTMSKV
jgi:hypothetical protein